jgi:hypothetical protein
VKALALLALLAPCVAIAAPADDAEARVRQIRALADAGRFAEALAVAAAGAALHADDPTWGRWRVRLLAWSGDHAGAARAEGALPAAARADADGQRLRADLAFWRGDPGTAIRGYDALLAAHPGDAEVLEARARARLALADRDRALADLRDACALGAAEACGRARAVTAEDDEPRYHFAFQPGWTYVDTLPAWWDVHLGLDARATARFTVGLGVDLQHRDLGDSPSNDAVVSAFSGLRLPGGVGLEVGSAFSPHAQRVARAQAWIEPSWQATRFLQVQARYWYLYFPGGGAHVVSPSARLDVGPLSLAASYYGSLDAAHALHHVVIGRLGFRPAPGWQVEGGGGGGDANDYLEAPSGAEAHRILLGGVAHDLDAAHRVTLDYVFHDERTDTRHLQRHQLLVGYRVSL